MKTWFANHSKFLYPLIIAVVILILAIVNHISGTWLLGWDSLSDEFNFKINFQRQFLGVWNEYQGLGTAGGHAHSADIPRFLYLFLASIVLPTSVLRYSYFFLTLLVGAIGMFYLVKYIFNGKPQKDKLALIATSFYIFNLGTLQIFYVPFEMFNAQFMVLPWIFMYVIKYIRRGEIKDYLYLCLFIILGTPQGYAPVLYYALIGSVAGFLFVYLIIHSNRLQIFLRSIYIGIAFIFLNLYWILPNLYYIRNYSASVSEAKINSLFSEEAFLYSSKWGTWLDFPILRGFLFGWLEYKHTSGENNYLMGFWRMYMANPVVLTVGMAFFVIIILGVVAALIKRRLILVSFIPIFVLWLFMVIGANGILAPLWLFLRDHMELFKEGLRFPYSKFSILLQFGYTIFFVYGVAFLLKLLNKVQNDRVKLIKNIFLWIFIFAPLIYMYPFFTGNLISKEMQIKLPTEYQSLFDKFAKEDPNKRIVYLPANNLFGWEYYDWGNQGYQGAGFVWFGLAQSFVTRDFDRWHPANEQLYTQLQYAIYNEDPDLFEYLLKKYDVSYIILDKNIISPNTSKSLYFKETDDLLKLTKNLQLTDTLGSIEVYNYKNLTPSESYVKFTKETDSNRQIQIEKGHPYYDTNYVDNKSSYFGEDFYKSTDLNEIAKTHEAEISFTDSMESSANKSFSVSIPFASRKEAIPVEFTLANTELRMKYIYPEVFNRAGEPIFTNVPEDLFPSISTGTNQVLVNNTLLKSANTQYEALIDEKSQLVEFSPQNSGVFDYSKNIFSATATDCNGIEGEVAKSYDTYPGSIGVETINGVTGCLNFEDRINNSQPTMYKVSFEYQNSDAAIPMYCLSDAKDGKCLNRQYESRPESSVGKFNTYEDYVLLDKPGNIRFVLVLASDDHLTAVSGSFRKLSIERFEVHSIKNLLNPALRGLEKNISVKASDFPLKVKFPDYSGLSSDYLPGSTKFNSKARSCDEFSENSYKRDFLNSTGRSAYEYSSEDAISCDTLESSIINANASYLVSFDNENVSGQGLDICLWGINIEKCLLQEKLSGGVESYLLPSYSSAGGVGININNSSIGRIPTTNRLYGVNVGYFPYAWLKELVIRDNAAELISNVQTAAVSKKSLYQYDIKVGVQPAAQKVVTLALDQSYDNGWVLLDKDSCFMGVVAPILCKKPESSHFLYNGWANGWYFNADSSNYTIIFWPQLLQIAGYLLFLLFIGTIVIGLRISSPYRSSDLKA